MAMNFNQMLKFQQIKNAFKRFDQDHPKFKNFMNAVWREQALKQDAVIEISITSPEGKNYCSNIKLNAADIHETRIISNFNVKLMSRNPKTHKFNVTTQKEG